ncbi:hypothetical protein BDA99DRAFT_499650 [Phascolomyces articulosus]|uniref:Uncharacterized protein n=1 Tax=Phascolomyces articulosus TaxID=60185 RepID=A0AAD5K7M2_9FUNG|nr:hypothetical protein BDA99DRAFT_499650 [Phascolomyces articulosus]
MHVFIISLFYITSSLLKLETFSRHSTLIILLDDAIPKQHLDGKNGGFSLLLLLSLFLGRYHRILETELSPKQF